MRALLWFIGIPYKITVGMIRSVKKVFHNASRTQVQVQSWTIPFWGHCGQLGPFRGVNYRFLGF